MKKILMLISFLLISNHVLAFQTELLAKVVEAVKQARKIKTAANVEHASFLKAPKYASGVTQLGDAAKVESAVSSLGDRLHATWQVEARASGKTERFKPMKVDGKPITTEADLQKYLNNSNIPAEYRKRFKLMDDGKGNVVAHEDILNMPNRYLAPNNQFENTASAYNAVMFTDKWLAAGGKIDDTFMRAASSFVHDQWMARNGWAKDQSPELFKPFDQLSAKEAKKDTDIVNDALKMYYDKLSVSDVNKLKHAGSVLKGAGSGK
ncbi:MAG: hypothetical protein KDD45_14270 [Bdellovibrionales bacterium]|nr:hypothetical protein [Bdellovibrionales bacterium]